MVQPHPGLNGGEGMSGPPVVAFGANWGLSGVKALTGFFSPRGDGFEVGRAHFIRPTMGAGGGGGQESSLLYGRWSMDVRGDGPRGYCPPGRMVKFLSDNWGLADVVLNETFSPEVYFIYCGG